MVSRKISGAVNGVVVVLVLVLTIGLGLVFGYQYVLGQNRKIEFFEKQVKQAEDLATATTASYETNEAGETILPTDENGNAIPTTSMSLIEVAPKDEVVLDENSDGAVMVYIKPGYTTSDIATQLKTLGVIENNTLFNIFSKVNGFDGAYQYGTHFVRKGMSFDQLMFILTQAPATKNIHFRDEYTTDDLKEKLKSSGVLVDEKALDEMLKHPENFIQFDFVKVLLTTEKDKIKKGRHNILQGYLFPDTYRFDLNVEAETVLLTMLNNFDNKLTKEHYERATAIGMSMDEVLTLASIIQKESGRVEDMYKISRVFHNRLQNGDRLQSDVTVNYIRKRRGDKEVVELAKSDLEINDPYNTYVFAGLPPGPICSPGLDAIEAALYPDTTQRDLYYFLAKADGSTAFANTLAEHEANVDLYLDEFLAQHREGGN